MCYNFIIFPILQGHLFIFDGIDSNKEHEL